MQDCSNDKQVFVAKTVTRRTFFSFEKSTGVRQVCYATIFLSISYCILCCNYWKNPDSNVFRCHNSQHSDTQHNDIQHNCTQHKELICDTQHDWLHCLHITVRKLMWLLPHTHLPYTVARWSQIPCKALHLALMQDNILISHCII